MAKVFITSHYINLKMLPALRLIVSNVEKSPLPSSSIHFSFFKVSFSHLIDHTDCDHGWINLIEEDDKYDFRIKKTYQLEPCCIRQGLYSSFDLTFSHHRQNNSDDCPSYRSEMVITIRKWALSCWDDRYKSCIIIIRKVSGYIMYVTDNKSYQSYALWRNTQK